MSFDDGVIMLGAASACSGRLSPRDLTAVNQSLCIDVAEPDAHHARALAGGAEIVRPLEDTDYGARGYSAKDLEGHVWTFSNCRPGGGWEQPQALAASPHSG